MLKNKQINKQTNKQTNKKEKNRNTSRLKANLTNVLRKGGGKVVLTISY